MRLVAWFVLASAHVPSQALNSLRATILADACLNVTWKSDPGDPASMDLYAMRDFPPGHGWITIKRGVDISRESFVVLRSEDPRWEDLNSGTRVRAFSSTPEAHELGNTFISFSKVATSSPTVTTYSPNPQTSTLIIRRQDPSISIKTGAVLPFFTSQPGFSSTVHVTILTIYRIPPTYSTVMTLGTRSSSATSLSSIRTYFPTFGTSYTIPTLTSSQGGPSTEATPFTLMPQRFPFPTSAVDTMSPRHSQNVTTRWTPVDTQTNTVVFTATSRPDEATKPMPSSLRTALFVVVGILAAGSSILFAWMYRRNVRNRRNRNKVTPYDALTSDAPANAKEAEMAAALGHASDQRAANLLLNDLPPSPNRTWTAERAARNSSQFHQPPSDEDLSVDYPFTYNDPPPEYRSRTSSHVSVAR